MAQYRLSKLLSKTVIVSLLWEISTDILGNLILDPLYHTQVISDGVLLLLSIFIAIIFLISPLVGFLADIKFGRFVVLKYGTYIMITSNSILVVILVVLPFSGPNETNYVLDVIGIVFWIIFILYGFGRMIFMVNIIQFVMDQLRDAPTKKSILFLNMYFWVGSYSDLITDCIIVFIGSISINVITHPPFHVAIPKYIAVFLIITALSSTLLQIFTIFTVTKNKCWFTIDKINGNPYRLVYSVLKFGLLNSKPLYRSAFTYCENEIPSRIDFGKQKYGGPFTTEQVEDVKVFLRIIFLLIILSPVFMLQWGAGVSIAAQNIKWNVNNVYEELFLGYGLLSPLFSVVIIPFYLILIKPYVKRYVPNMFKRIGFSIIINCICYLHLFAFNYISVESSNHRGELIAYCNDTIFASTSQVKILPQYILTVEHILVELQTMVFYIALWEFICSQSPQNMKGFIFGCLYALRSLSQLVAVSLVLSNVRKWKSAFVSCQSVYYIVNAGIGTFTLIIFTIFSRRYQYRKRNDICNVYQYAEDYYSNIQ